MKKILIMIALLSSTAHAIPTITQVDAGACATTCLGTLLTSAGPGITRYQSEGLFKFCKSLYQDDGCCNKTEDKWDKDLVMYRTSEYGHCSEFKNQEGEALWVVPAIGKAVWK